MGKYILTIYGFGKIVGKDLDRDVYLIVGINGTWYGTLPIKHSSLNNNRKDSNMGTIRQKIRNALLSKEERLLRKYDVLDGSGALTNVGRRIVADVLFEDDKVRAEVVARLQTVDDEEKNCKDKKSK